MAAKRLSPEDIAACKSLAIRYAEGDVDWAIAQLGDKVKLPANVLGDELFSDWGPHAEYVTDILVEHGYLEKPRGFSYGHEKLFAFTLFQETYEKRLIALVKDRNKRFLQVPFQDNAAAKALGAKFDPVRKTWYVPEGVNPGLFLKWLEPTPEPSVPAPKLFIDLVPNTAWFSNLRSELTAEEWDRVKKATFVPAGYRCQACNGRGPKHPVECHERWQYDEVTKVQKLIGTIALCPACHESTHFGLARVRGREVQARQHLMAVNNWTSSQVARHIQTTMEEGLRRSRIPWTLDARWLIGFVELSAPTKLKILNHSNGIGERKIEEWQKEISLDQARKAGI